MNTITRRFTLIIAVAALLAITAGVVLATQNSAKAVAQDAPSAEMKTYDDLYVCSMHPYEASEGPGNCSICSMKLSPVEGHKPGTPLPEVHEIYVNPKKPMQLHEGHKEGWMPITKSPMYRPKKDDHGKGHMQGMHGDKGKARSGKTSSGCGHCG